MAYWLESIDDLTFDVTTRKGAHGPYPTEEAAHEAALGLLLKQRAALALAITETRRRINACRKGSR